MPISLFINKKTISYALGTLATLSAIGGGSLWVFDNIAWKKDLLSVVKQFESRTDRALIESLRIRHTLARSDYDLYSNAIRNIEAKETLTSNDRLNLSIFRDNLEDAKIDKENLESRINFLQRKVDGVR
jgi:hypothetical protein